MTSIWIRWMNLDTQWNTRWNTIRFSSEMKHVFHLRSNISYCLIWEDMSKTRALCFITGSKHLETDESMRLWPHAFICLLVFGTRDKALALVFDILLEIQNNGYSQSCLPLLECLAVCVLWFHCAQQCHQISKPSFQYHCLRVLC